MIKFDPGILRQLRRARKMKLSDVATALCLTPACISKHENEESRMSAEDLARYIDLYQVDANIFFKETLE